MLIIVVADQGWATGEGEGEPRGEDEMEQDPTGNNPQDRTVDQR